MRSLLHYFVFIFEKKIDVVILLQQNNSTNLIMDIVSIKIN